LETDCGMRLIPAFGAKSSPKFPGRKRLIA